MEDCFYCEGLGEVLNEQATYDTAHNPDGFHPASTVKEYPCREHLFTALTGELSIKPLN